MPLVLDLRQAKRAELIDTANSFKACILGPESHEDVQHIEVPRLGTGDWVEFYKDGRTYRLVGVGHGAVRFDVPGSCAIVRPGRASRATETA
jgi:hypothetical protein